jgi:hypothetical protein
MNFVIDFDKEISEQWNEQFKSTTYVQKIGLNGKPQLESDQTTVSTAITKTINPHSIDIYNFPTKTGSILARSAGLKKLTELFELIQLKNWVTLNFKESKDLFVSEEFKRFHKVQFDIFPLTIDVNKLFTDLKQLLQLENMTIICKIDQEKPCHELVNVLQYILVLKNKNYPGTVLFE